MQRALSCLKAYFPKLTDISVSYRVAVELNISNKYPMIEIVLNNDICNARNWRLTFSFNNKENSNQSSTNHSIC